MRIEPPVSAEVLAAVRAPLEASGAERADAPLLQPLNLLLDLAGEAMRARLFVVQAEGGTESCLRPDFTVAIARQHIESARAAGLYWYQGAAFRASSGSDRPEEFVQLGLEMFSPGGGRVEAADAEIAGLAWRAAAAGGRADLSLWLGDVALFGAFVESLDLPESLAARLKRVAGRPRLLWSELSRVGETQKAEGGTLAGLLAGLSETQAAALLEEVWALAGVEPVGGRGPAEIAARLVRKAEAANAPALTETQSEAIRAFMVIDDAPAYAFARMRELSGANDGALKAALAGWEARLLELTRIAPADRLRFAPALGHAFDYYDGITFEVRSEALGPDRAVAVGGRYDGLLTRLGGAGDARAVGCMVRPWRAWTGGES
ncbi:MAG: ATP phosphoribosyltransferase regulatory subunit [Alphaproteobacteria bacterium]|nr:ATP phosphoribosyltransferase regulatory subunit [Alphaproteobacteria bacterium]MBU1516997.1 ATP phosphoribosyltransferase regulatory subunit [Alphaproteobacteria bacterium]MBU2093577.1 ATP phosphoribosyltransferase regulatory subunit [Alphaproteobacteria bacterium]MBU2152859.1 ATP phosphoribosyltransferase regulatory subunit [Alphaproteobacteria bacterium]MBU2305565.1 ATP phosphoribosyltransferase regulatory subunit [Alphaproteobacteria bacterium]